MASFIHRAAAALVAVLLICIVCASPAVAEWENLLNPFKDVSQWKVFHSDGVTVKSEVEHSKVPQDEQPRSLRLDFDFASAGYGGIRRQLPLDLPPNFEIEFGIRGDLPPNNLELKLVDESGQTVWWVNRRSFEFPQRWNYLASRRRHFQYAWGPSTAPLSRAGALEIVVSSAEGGRGSVFISFVRIRPLPEAKPYTGVPTVTASSSAGPDAAPQLACDGKYVTGWRSADGDEFPELKIDFGASREFGGLVIDWDPNAPSQGYLIEISEDGDNWSAVANSNASARRQYVSLPDSEGESIRLHASPGKESKSVGVRELEILPTEATRDPNTFAMEIARRAPRGYYPRPYANEGYFWTVIGAPGDDHEALISEDGAAEVDKKGFSIEPFLYVDDRMLTWAEASTTQSLAKGYAPVPTVTRTHDNLRLEIAAAADGDRDCSSLLLRYQLTNTSAAAAKGALYLTLRPLQVNPPYQWLNAGGGVARVSRIALDDSRRVVNVDGRTIALGEAPTNFGAATFEESDVSEFISKGLLPPQPRVEDAQRAASAAIEYRFDLKAGESHSWVVSVPFSQDKQRREELARPLLSAADPIAYVRDRENGVTSYWENATNSFELLVPESAADLVNTVRSTLAYILINRDGPAIQPGSRAYERSWIRDGSLTTAALLRYGLDQPAREFVDWYAPYQFENGKVPCVVDRRGADPVPENDSHGQLIMAVMNVYRFTGDKEFLKRHWPQVERAVAYIESLRAERMTPEYADAKTNATRQEPGKPAVNLHAFYGLMPESISHEGYSAKPMHSYWDDFFTLKGLKDAAEMADVLGHDDEATRYKTLADDFARTLYASIDAVTQAHGIDYIPGCVELGDFDATSTTIALWPCGEIARLPRPALDHTFDRYWARFLSRRDDPSFAWTDYTPYELRCVGSLIQLGHPDRAQQALEFFLHDRRPPAWNQWPEVVYHEPRTAKFLGDLPHTWCGSDFLNSVRMMFLYERDADQALVLLAGVPESWISSKPVGFRNMPTYGGHISCTVESVEEGGDHMVANVLGTCPVPSGGICLTVPVAPVIRATVNGKPAAIDADGCIVVNELPARIEVVAESRKKQ